MMKSIGTAALAMMVLIVGPGRIELSAASSSLPSAVRASQAFDAGARPTDISARRYAHRYHRYGYRHYRYGYRPYYPRYYARPYYYEPYPSYGPAPLAFGFGFGFGPWW